MVLMHALASRPSALALREAFMLALPIVIAMSLMQLLFTAMGWLAPALLEAAWAALLQVPQALRATLPFLIMLALVAVLARRRGAHRGAAALTGFAALCGVAAAIPDAPLVLLSLPLAFLTVYLMGVFAHWTLLELIGFDAPLSPAIRVMLKVVPAAVATLFCVTVVGIVLAAALHGTLVHMAAWATLPAGFGGDALQVCLSTVATQGLWFLGLHGSNLSEELVRQWYAQADPSSRVQAVINGFAHLGGAGSTLALVIASLWQKNRSATRSVSKVALPFAVFNVNEVLIYGLPIAFNPMLLLPFVAAPVVNGLVTLAALELGVFSIADSQVHWATPPLLAAWLASGGSVLAVLTQALCPAIDVMIYRPFVRAEAEVEGDSFEKVRHLFLEHSAVRFVQTALESRSEERFMASVIESQKAEAQLQASLTLLDGGRFIMFYQPKVDLDSGAVVGGESLLRLLDAQGQVRGPSFLPDLMRLGLSSSIDDKVVVLVVEQLEAWRAEGFVPPPISVNLDRDFLYDTERVEGLLRHARQYPGCLEAEVTEHTFMTASEGLAATVAYLRSNGVPVSLDDFGAGYSSLGRLGSMECDVVKLDR